MLQLPKHAQKPRPTLPLVLPLVLAHSPRGRDRWEAAALSVAPLVLVLMTCTLDSYLGGVLLVGLALLAWRGYRRLAGTRTERYLLVATVATILCFLPFTLEMLANPSFSAGPILSHATQLTEGHLALQGEDLLYVFFAAYGAVCLYAHRIAVGREGEPGVRYRDLVDVGLLAALCFTALGTVNPQYVIVVVVLGLLRLGRSRDGAAAYALQCVGLFLYMVFFHDGAVTNWLLAPVSPDVVKDLPGPLGGLPAFFDDLGPIGLGHSLFLLGALWMVHEVVRSRRAEERGPRLSASLVLGLGAWPVAFVVVLWLPFRGGVEVREEFEGLTETAVPTLATGAPLDGLELRTEDTRYDPEGSAITAVELRPTDGYIVDSLGWVYYRLGRYEEAVKELERAIELRPADPVINDHLGDAYWMVGRRNEARFQWNHARDLGPDDKELPKILDKIANGMPETPVTDAAKAENDKNGG